jgi:hypothetical protein
MNLVHEDEYGSYLGVTSDFLQEFSPVESNPNFDVFDSFDGYRRFIAVKSSRVPYDEDLSEGRYGIDFYRVKPTLEEAFRYGTELADGLDFGWLSDIAFAAKNEKEYSSKAAVWDHFYSYIWDTAPQTVWVAPHSGVINISPNEKLVFPEVMVDSHTAGVATRCAIQKTSGPVKRTMLVIHSTGQLGAILNLGDLGILKQADMDSITGGIERKYHEKVQALAGEFIHDYSYKTVKILENLISVKGTLDPHELATTSRDDSFTVDMYARCLKFYGQEISGFTLNEFKAALENLDKIDVPVILNNFIYPGRNVGRLLKLSDKIREGYLHTALQIEGAKLYMARDPELVADIIMDVKEALFRD